MLDMLASDMEIRHVGGEGLKGEGNEEEALCGIKLYKGETLLELTERWRILHKKLYDEDAEFQTYMTTKGLICSTILILGSRKR